MARGRGGFDFSSGGSSGYSSGPQPDLDELYPYPQHTLTALTAISSVFAVIFFLLLVVTRGVPRLLPVPFLLANALAVVRYALVIAGSSPQASIRYEYSATTLLLRLGLVAVFFAAIHQTKLKRRTLTPHGLSRVLHAISLLLLVLFAASSVAYAVMEFIIAAQSVAAYPDYNTWRLADFDYGAVLSVEQIDALKTLRNGGTRGVAYSFTRFFVDGLRKVQVRVGVGMSWCGVALCLVLTGYVAAVLMNARNHVGSKPWILLVAPVGLMLTMLLEGVVAVRWVLWNTNVLGDLGRWAAWASTVEEDLVVQMRTRPGDGWVLGYRTVGKGFAEAYATLWMVGVVGAILGVGLSARGPGRLRGDVRKG